MLADGCVAATAKRFNPRAQGRGAHPGRRMVESVFGGSFATPGFGAQSRWDWRRQKILERIFLPGREQNRDSERLSIRMGMYVLMNSLQRRERRDAMDAEGIVTKTCDGGTPALSACGGCGFGTKNGKPSAWLGRRPATTIDQDVRRRHARSFGVWGAGSRETRVQSREIRQRTERQTVWAS
jgi:hypothetical protein